LFDLPLPPGVSFSMRLHTSHLTIRLPLPGFAIGRRKRFAASSDFHGRVDAFPNSPSFRTAKSLSDRIASSTEFEQTSSGLWLFGMEPKKRSVLLAERAVQQAAEADGRRLQPIARLQPDTDHGRIIGGRSLAAIR
jgi:hypothetical protein